MDVLVRSDEPAISEWLERRRSRGQDLFDEVWEGTYRVAPHERAENGYLAATLAQLLYEPARAAGLEPGGPFKLGSVENYCVPDLSYHRGIPRGLYLSTAAIVVEVVSPSDRLSDKAAFYAAHEIEEFWIVEPTARTVRCHGRSGDLWHEVASSPLLGLLLADVEASLTWP